VHALLDIRELLIEAEIEGQWRPIVNRLNLVLAEF
jgi:ABC-type antimicrobial peptide transport system ATPase subunit